jgi:DNA-binding XRE family transcriptional regulator
MKMRYSDDQRKELLRKFELYRLDNCISVKDAAALIGVTAGTIVRWEDAKQLPHKMQCYQIEKVVKDFVPPVTK